MTTFAQPESMFKTAQAAMVANPSFLDASIAKLSPEAQWHARAIRDVVTSDEDPCVIHTKIAAIRAPLSPAILEELDAHRDRLVKQYGLPSN